jgi:hypothetical protein
MKNLRTKLGAALAPGPGNLAPVGLYRLAVKSGRHPVCRLRAQAA